MIQTMSSVKKVLTIGKDLRIINALLEQEGLRIVSEKPDVIVTHGGDGYLLDAERDYSGIPKLPIRYQSICKTCIDHDTTHAIKALARGTISTTDVYKLETKLGDEAWYALNEFSLHHVKPNQAIRFSVRIDGEPHTEQAIGDGVIIATPFGSHAYYRSITNSTFRLGLGIAFNNTTEPIDHTVVRATDPIHITVLRGPAYFLADNNPHMPILEAGQSLTIRQSKKKAILLGVDRFRCPDCETIGSVATVTDTSIITENRT